MLPAGRNGMFDEPDRQKQGRLDAAADRIKRLFGDSALGPASGLGARRTTSPLPGRETADNTTA